MKKKFSLLMVALLSIVGISTAAWRAASDPVIYSWPSDATAANEVTLAEGVTIAITGNAEKNVSSGKKITINGTEYTSIKNSNGAQNTLTLPKKATAITFYSYVNKKQTEVQSAAYWKEVNGVSYDEETSGGAMTCFSDGDFTKPDVRRFEFAEPTDVITFNNAGYQICYVVGVEYAEEGDEPEPVATEKTIYLAPGVWAKDGARFAVNAFNETENSWYDFTAVEGDDVYSVTIPASRTTIILARMNPETTENNWDNKYNQTEDIVFADIEDNTLFTITDWGTGKSPYETSTYASPVWTVAGDAVLFGSDWATDAEANDMVLDTESGLYTWTGRAYLTTAGAEFKVVKNHAFTVAYPENNWKINIAEEGLYDVVITFSANTKDITATATKIELDELANVTGDATWDWSKFGVDEIKLTDATTPKKTDEFVLSNAVKFGLCDAISEDFGNAQQLSVIAEYVTRVQSNMYFMQGNKVRFNTTVPGTVKVWFSNTGNRDETDDMKRFLYINGTNTDVYSLNTNMTEASLHVDAGEVVINAFIGVEEPKATMVRISKIEFVADAVAEPAYYLIGEFNEWSQDTKVSFTKGDDDAFELTKTFSGEFKLLNEKGEWLGAAAEGDYFLLTEEYNTVDLIDGQNLKLDKESEYTLTVKDGKLTVAGFPVEGETVTFDFENNEWKHGLATSTLDKTDGLFTDVLSKDGIDVFFGKGEGSDPYYYLNNGNPQVRIVKNNYVKVYAPAGKAIKQITFEAEGTYFNMTADGLAEKTWKGNATLVKFTATGTNRLTKMNVVVADADDATVTPEAESTYAYIDLSDADDPLYSASTVTLSEDKVVTYKNGLLTVTYQATKNEDAASKNRISYTSSNWCYMQAYTDQLIFEVPADKAITKIVFADGFKRNLTWNAANTINGQAYTAATLKGDGWQGNSHNVIVEFAGLTAMQDITVYIADKTAETTTYVAPNAYYATFETDAEWEEVYAYTWSGEGDSKVEQLGAWPGTKLTKNINKYNVTVKAFEAPEYIIFNNGQSGEGNQTEDFAFEAGKAYNYTVPVYYYYVVGGKKGSDNDASIFDGYWNVATTTNQMTLEEGVNYVWSTDGYVDLEAQTIELKVVKKAQGSEEAKAWYPENNVEVTIEKDGKYQVTVNFNSESGVVTALAGADPTGISSLKAAELQGAAIYNLQGQRMEQPVKGLNIVNGRKVVVK